jgi:phosphocarrier protein
MKIKSSVTPTLYAPLVGAVLLAQENLERHWRPHAEKVEKELAITNRSGLHVRPAAMLARLANRFHSKIWVTKDDVEVDGKSVMGLISLAAAPGAKLHIRVEGIDAAEAMGAIEQLIQSRFDEE